MNDFLIYQPYRFNRLARAAQRFGHRLSTGPLGIIEPAIGAEALSLSELQSRTKDVLRTTRMFNVWAQSGRRVFDLSSTMADLAGALGIEVGDFGQAEYPSSFYIHLGADAGLQTRYGSNDYIEGAYAQTISRSGVAGLELAYVCGARSNEDPEAMSFSDILRTQSRVVFAFVDFDRLPDLFSSVDGGDPLLARDPVMAAAATRILVALKHIGSKPKPGTTEDDQPEAILRPI
ncbi:hypothetical protein [Rhizobium mesoamericanum]|uniref:hypothetical protein n=1 Tax=Rhizobium mesoamericanum TaxID=1079800 RepID=UPI00040C4197|nr:hypothetical protein [Rhizobium mesoamericanum]